MLHPRTSQASLPSPQFAAQTELPCSVKETSQVFVRKSAEDCQILGRTGCVIFDGWGFEMWAVHDITLAVLRREPRSGRS